MLQQLLEDRDSLVKEKAVKALALVFAYCDDSDKYCHCEDLALSIMDDSNINVVKYCVEILLPVLAEWALITGKFFFYTQFICCAYFYLINIFIVDKLHSTLLKNLLHKLNLLVKLSQSDSPTKKQTSSDDDIIQIINVLDTLLSFMLVYIVDVEPIISRITEGLVVELRK